MIRLSQRLSLIASLVPKGAKVCDVGTDHGYLPAFLYLSGDYPSVTATDINEKPLECAKNNLERLGAEKVKLVLCDGLDGISADAADCVIIAGMGGEVISGIISRCEFLKGNVRLLLQPMTAAAYLRKFLGENGFLTEKEYAVKENGKLYSVLSVVYDGKKRSLSPALQRIGALSACDETGREYIEKQYKICLKCSGDLKNIPEKAAEYAEFLSAAGDLKAVLEEENGI